MSEPTALASCEDEARELTLQLVAAELRILRLVRTGTDALVALGHAAGALGMAEAPEPLLTDLGTVAGELRSAVLDLALPIVIVEGET